MVSKTIKRAIFLFFTILLVFVSVCGFLYYKKLKHVFENETKLNLMGDVQSSSSYTKELLLTNLQILSSTALLINDHVSQDLDYLISKEQLMGILQKESTINKFSVFGLADVSGNMETTDGRTISISDRTYFQEAIKGNANIESGLVSRVHGKETTAFAAPIGKDGQVRYILVGLYDSKHYSDLMKKSVLSGEGFSIVTDREGKIIYQSARNRNILEGENIFNVRLDGSQEELNNTVKIFKRVIKKEETGFQLVSINGEKMYIGYAPVELNGYMQFSIVPLSLVLNRTAEMTAWTLLAGVGMVLFVFVAAISVFKVISKLEKQKQELAVMNNKTKILFNHLNDIIFELNRKTGELTFNHNLKKILGKEESFIKNIDDLWGNGSIHPEDVQQAKWAFEKVLEEKTSNVLEMRVRHEFGHFIWFSVTVAPIVDDLNNLISLMGNMENIHVRKVEMDLLKKNAQRDSLTNLYNKEATSILIDDYLQEKQITGECALIGIDLDNFKGINDYFGHLFGDNVLIEFGTLLKSTFRETDILGRFGGDEFVVFLKDVAKKDIVIEKANQIVNSFVRRYTVADVTQTVTASVGIAFYTGIENYSELFRKADIALYQSKNTGKSVVHVYQESNE